MKISRVIFDAITRYHYNKTKDAIFKELLELEAESDYIETNPTRLNYKICFQDTITIDTTIYESYVYQLERAKSIKTSPYANDYIIIVPAGCSYPITYLFTNSFETLEITKEEALKITGYCHYYWKGRVIKEYYEGLDFLKDSKVYSIYFNRLTPERLTIGGLYKDVEYKLKQTVPLFEHSDETYTIPISYTGKEVKIVFPDVSFDDNIACRVKFFNEFVEIRSDEYIFHKNVGKEKTYLYLDAFRDVTVKSSKRKEVVCCCNSSSSTMTNKANTNISFDDLLTTNVFLTGNASGTTATINFGSTATTTAEPCSWDTITTNSISNNPLVFSPPYTPMTTNGEVPYNSFTTNKDTIFTSTMENEKENKNMFKFDFGTCENMNLRMSPYGLAVKKSDGWVSYDSKSETIIDVDIFAFDCGKYIMRMPVPVSSVAEGDMIMHNGSPVYVTAVNKKNFEVIDPLHGEEKTIKATMSPFGFNFITKVIPLFNAFNSTEASDENPFGNMLPFMLMSQDGGNIDPMVMAMMFMNGNGAASDNNMMKFLPFALMSQNGNNKSDYLPYIMMMGMNNIG